MDPTGAIASAGIQAAGQALGGIVKFGASLFGGGKRRREQREAAKQLAAERSKFEQLDTGNVYENIENTFEDLTVNTQAADFAAQQSQAANANIMSGLAGAAGGSGIAALAQSMANSQAQQAQQASATIAQQEQSNARLAAQGESQRQMAIAGGEAQSQKMAYEKQSTLLGMAQQRKAAADQARQDATNQMVGGLTDMAGGVAGASMANKSLKSAVTGVDSAGDPTYHKGLF